MRDREDALVARLEDALRYAPSPRAPARTSEERLISDLLVVASEKDVRVVRAALARFEGDGKALGFKGWLHNLLIPLVFVVPKDDFPPGKPYGDFEIRGGRLALPKGFSVLPGDASRYVLGWFDDLAKSRPRRKLDRFRSQIIEQPSEHAG